MQIAKKGTTMLLPSTAHDPASMVAQALSIYGTVSGSRAAAAGEGAAGAAEKEEGGKASSSALQPR